MKAVFTGVVIALVPAVVTVMGFYVATSHPALHLAFCQLEGG